mmetsp:Transcript_23665/g.65633  ORF Transcript_23665/g.65633 Transcript_23665/m.65633 type:complete len:401 (-) Transcript_23665:82-1284(-)
MADGAAGLGYVVQGQGEVTGAVADPKLCAGRGREFSAAYLVDQQNALIEESIANDEDFRLPIDHQPEQSLRRDGIPMADMDTPIPENNVGYQMLLKLGWSVGKGLGRDGSGRVNPIRGGENAGLRFGVGKVEQDRQYTAEENITRRKLASEVQLEETEEEARKREMKAEQQERIKEVVKEELSTFYCELCNKQYKTAMELETHLSSYDHHHKKRLIEMKQMQSERTKADRTRREKRQMEKELAKMNAQVKRAQQMQQQQQQQQSAGSSPSPHQPPSATGHSSEPRAEPPPAAAPGSTGTSGAPHAGFSPATQLGSSIGGGGGSQVPAEPTSGAGPAPEQPRASMAFSLSGRGGAGAMTMKRGAAPGRGLFGRSAGRAPGGRGTKPGAGLAAFALESDSDD